MSLNILVYRLNCYKWPCNSGTFLKLTCPVQACIVAYTIEVPEQHSHVYLVRLYLKTAMELCPLLATKRKSPEGWRRISAMVDLQETSGKVLTL